MKKIVLPIDVEEGDNITPGKPAIKWMISMLSILILFIVSWYLIFIAFAHLVIWNISLEDEKKYFWDFMVSDEQMILFNTDSLQNKLVGLDNLDIYLSESEEVNAYAILWWNIVITKWLLENIEYEEELIFILWHEASHVYNRDVLKSMLSNIPFVITLYFLGYEIWIDYIDIVDLTSNYVSKTTELNADDWWIKLLNDMELNLECSLNFFNKDTDIFSSYLQFISTHPTNISRIKNIRKNNKFPDKECSELKLNIN